MWRVFNFFISFLIHVYAYIKKLVKSLSFQQMWSVEEIHVSHMISIRRMSKRLSNQPTARLIMHAGTARVMLALDEIN